MKGVEIITGLQTSDETLKQTLSLAAKMGKIPSRSVDSPGFLANRLLIPYINEAIICLETVFLFSAILIEGCWRERGYRQYHEEWMQYANGTSCISRSHWSRHLLGNHERVTFGHRRLQVPSGGPFG